MMFSRLFRVVCVSGFVLCAAESFAAEAALQPLPTPDTSKLAPAAAKQLVQDRADFEAAKHGLVGPPLANDYANIGAIYTRSGFKDIAAVAFFDASQINPKDSRWLYLRGVIARDLKQNAEARANFEAAYALDKVYLPIRYRLADTLVDLNELDAARSLLEATSREFPDQAVPRAMLGQIALRQKRYPEAIEQLNAALKLDPPANELYKYISDAYAAEGNTQAAQDAKAKIGTVSPALADPIVAGIYGTVGVAASAAVNTNLPPVSGTALQQAQQLFAQGRFLAARAKVSEAVSASNDNADAIALSARIEATLGNSAIAMALIDSAIKLKPSDANFLGVKGQVYEMNGDEAHAIEFYQRAVQADPKQVESHTLLGNADMRHARYASAIDHYRQVVAARPDLVVASARLVAAQVASGRCADALREINSALGARAKDGDLMQIFVRLASTCSAAKQEERDMALDYAQALYKQRPDAGDSAALALAMAAHGKYQDAQQYQAEAIFQSMRAGDSENAALDKSTQTSFVANKLPDRPWPADNAYFKPPMLTPAARGAAAAKPAAK